MTTPTNEQRKVKWHWLRIPSVGDFAPCGARRDRVYSVHTLARVTCKACLKIASPHPEG